MSGINLASSVRTDLLAVQRAAETRNEVARRLSTSREVQRAADRPSTFFQAQALSERASDLFEAKAGIGQALSAIKSALDATDTLTGIAEQLQGIARSALGGTSDTRQVAAEQFDSLRQQLGNLALDATYLGTNLVRSDTESLTVSLSDRETSQITVEGAASGADGLGIRSALQDFEAFASDDDIYLTLRDLNDAISSLRTTASGFGSDAGVLGIREDFASRLGNTLSSGAADLVDADLNEEAARLLSSQVRQDVASLGLGIAAQGEQQISQILFAR